MASINVLVCNNRRITGALKIQPNVNRNRTKLQVAYAVFAKRVL